MGALYYAETEEGTFTYEDSARNFVANLVPTFGPRQDITYERGNVKRITYQQYGPGQSTYVESTYPADCVNVSRKTCNQPLSTRDARGYYTRFTSLAIRTDSVRASPCR